MPRPTRSKLATSLSWTLLAGIPVGAAVAIQWAARRDLSSHQERTMLIGQIVLCTIGGLLIWLLAFSPFTWAGRLLSFGALVLGVGVAAFLVRIEGVTGDLVPIIAWRWAKPALAPLPDPNGAAAAAKPQPGSDAEYPQFLGPNRDATIRGPNLATNWNQSPPQLLWRTGIGAAWSGFAISRGRAVTQEQRGDDECVVCYDALSGKVIWAHRDAALYSTAIAGEGPRATPTIARGRVYSVGATGILNCLELETGKPVWSVNILTSNGAGEPEWGISGSPLVSGPWVIVNPGGVNEKSVVAYDSDSGKVAWSGGTDSAGYSSPVELRVAGATQILMFGGSNLTSYEPGTGKVLWTHPWPNSYPKVTTPILAGVNRVLASSGYGYGSELLDIHPGSNAVFAVTRLWKSNRLKSKFANLFIIDGFIYGLDDGIMTCLELETGKPRWKDGRYGHGQMILAGSVLLVMAESGSVILVDPNPRELKEIAQVRVFEDKTWNPPALAGELLLVRNHKEAAAYRVPLEAAPGLETAFDSRFEFSRILSKSTGAK